MVSHQRRVLDFALDALGVRHARPEVERTLSENHHRLLPILALDVIVDARMRNRHHSEPQRGWVVGQFER